MQRYFALAKEQNKLILNNDDLYHIKTVMRMRENDQIEVVFNNQLYIGKLLTDYQVEVVKTIPTDINDKQIILLIPLLKESKMDLILQKSTELGVSKIIPVELERSIVKLDVLRAEKRLIRWQKILREASEQSKRIDIPIITPIKKIDNLTDLNGLKIVCSTNERQNTLKKVLKNNKGYDKIIVLIGPEGGLTDKEENNLVNKGFIKVTLGQLIMRVETVPLFVLSALNYESMVVK